MDTIIALFAYSDRTNATLLHAAEPLSAAQLDQSFDMGMGTLRKTLAHIYVGEKVWLERCTGNAECKWPPYETSVTLAEISEQLRLLIHPRDAFLATLNDAKVGAGQTYRDSKGTLFKATLHDMILQSIVHSTHHRAQAVNMLRRLGGQVVEVDYMYGVRETV